MISRRLVPVAVSAFFLALGLAGATLRAQGEHGLFLGLEAVLGFWEGLMTGVAAAAVAVLLAKVTVRALGTTASMATLPRPGVAGGGGRGDEGARSR